MRATRLPSPQPSQTRASASSSTTTTLSREELETIAEDAVGTDEITVIEVRNVEVDGNTATAELLLTIDNTISLESYTLVREADVWLIDGTSLLQPEIPEGVTNLEVDAGDFFFEYDADLITDGSIAFTMENVGEQDHELGLARVTEDFDIDDVLTADPDSEDLPPGVTDIIYRHLRRARRHGHDRLRRGTRARRLRDALLHSRRSHQRTTCRPRHALRVRSAVN